jgi:hypothetical protein
MTSLMMASGMVTLTILNQVEVVRERLLELIVFQNECVLSCK